MNVSNKLLTVTASLSTEKPALPTPTPSKLVFTSSSPSKILATQTMSQSKDVPSENDPRGVIEDLKRKALGRQPVVVVVDLAHENPRDSPLWTRKRARLADLINNNNITVGKDERGAPCSNSQTRRLPGPASAQVRKDATEPFAQAGTPRGTPASPGSAQEQTTRGGAQNPKEDEDSGSETDDTEPMGVEDREHYMVGKVTDIVSLLSSDSAEVQLIQEAMQAEKKCAMRRYLLRLCMHLGYLARERQAIEKTVTMAVKDRRHAEEALTKTENQSSDLHFSLQMERKKNRRLCIGVQKYVRMEEAGRFTLTDAEKEELRKVKEMVDSDEDFTSDD